MDDPAQSVNATYIQNGLLWPYSKSLALYKCPADPKMGTGGRPTLRSMSMNGWLNPVNRPDAQGLSGPGKVFKKQTDIGGRISPTTLWVLLDESDKTINDSWFVVSSQVGGANGTIWVDLPGSYHNNAGGLLYADGHAEIKKWRDKTVLRGTALFSAADASIPPNPPGYGDLVWLRQRSTYVP